MREISLQQLQRQFKEDVLKKTSACLPCLKEDLEFSNTRRFQVYRGTIELVIDYVAGDFSELEQLIGERRLRELVDEFLRKEPSRTADMQDIGEHFSDFLRRYHNILWSEVAKYDWAQTLALANDEPRFAYFPISELTEFEDIQLVTHPSLQLLESPIAVHKDKTTNPTFLAVRFHSGDVCADELTASEFRILSALKSEITLPEILTQLEGLPSTEAEVSQAFTNWVKNGTIVGFLKKRSTPK